MPSTLRPYLGGALGLRLCFCRCQWSRARVAALRQRRGLLAADERRCLREDFNHATILGDQRRRPYRVAR